MKQLLVKRQEEDSQKEGSKGDVTKIDSQSSGPMLNNPFVQRSFFPNFDGKKDSGVYNSRRRLDSDDEDDKPDIHIDCSGGGYPWQNEKYWKLPENVRNAIDIAELKQKHTEFWRRLETLNDKIYVFRSVFYTKMPSY